MHYLIMTHDAEGEEVGMTDVEYSLEKAKRGADRYAADLDDTHLVTVYEGSQRVELNIYQVAGKVKTTLLVTSAPEAYDGFGTTTAETLPWRPRAGQDPYRVVRIREDAMGWQTMRYASGMYPAKPREEFDKLVEYGLVVPA